MNLDDKFFVFKVAASEGGQVADSAIRRSDIKMLMRDPESNLVVIVVADTGQTLYVADKTFEGMVALLNDTSWNC